MVVAPGKPISNTEEGMEHEDAIDYSAIDTAIGGGFNPASPANRKTY
jgi:hypothetical protein